MLVPAKKILQFKYKAYYREFIYDEKYSQCIDIIYIDFIRFRIKIREIIWPNAFTQVI